MSLFQGVGVAIVTPFKGSDVNYEVLGQLIEFHIDGGTAAIIACGTTGESATLSEEEKLAIFDYCVKYSQGRIPIIAGTGSNNTAQSITLSVRAQALGVDGLLLVTPYYNKPSQAGLIAHYEAIANAVTIPIILYNVPSRTSVNLLPQTVQVLAKHPMIQGIKEACGDMEQITHLASLIPKDFFLYSGNDDQVYPVLELGGQGVISVTSNVAPTLVSEPIRRYFQGDVTSAKQEFERLLPLHQAMFLETNPVPVKTILPWLGYHVGGVRLPLVMMSPDKEPMLRTITTRFGVGR
jgi:4-hydroxy-tetrahydrodipicolinate synthase